MTSLAQQNFRNWLKQRKENLCHRQILVISDSGSCSTQSIKHTCEELNIKKPLFVNFPQEYQPSIDDEQYTQVLGDEFDSVFYQCETSIRANALAALSGVIKKGGLMVLVSPTGTIGETGSSLFRRWLLLQLLNDSRVNWLDENQFVGGSVKVGLQHEDLDSNFVYEEQNKLVLTLYDEMIKKNQVKAVLQADRGRGKSSALGILAAKLVAKEGFNIIVTAPRNSMLASFKSHCKFNIQDNDHLQKIKFWPLDKLLAERPLCDLLIVDEAAAIPNQILVEIISICSRVIISSTSDGYEGSGRSFEHKFIPFMRRTFPTEMLELSLKQPIRWFSGDCLEDFWWNTLLMKISSSSEIADSVNTLPIEKESELEYRQLSASELINKPELLEQSIQLLINAHYQTTPDDIMRMLDDTNQSIHIMYTSNSTRYLDSHDIGNQQNNLDSHICIKAIALVNREGGQALNNTATNIANGTRRLKGHLSAQRLAFVYGTAQLALFTYLRVVRIAVSPQHQRKGIGAALLTHLEFWARSQQADFLCSSFGVTKDLLTFWFRQALTPINFGLTADASNGLNSVIVCKPLNHRAREASNLMATRCLNDIRYQRSRRLKHIQPEVLDATESKILTFLEETSEKASNSLLITLDNLDFAKIDQFIQRKRPIYSCERELHKLIINACQVDKVFFGNTFLFKSLVQDLPGDQIKALFTVTGKKQMEDLARQEALTALNRISASGIN